MTKKLERLKDRAAMLSAARAFFAERGIMEVDCPIVSERAAVDAHIDLIAATYHHTTPCYLHSSPEYGMKRLLAEGIGDIYQLSHVFRDGEHGARHNPEFTMAEWYRIGMTFEELIEETADFARLFLGDLPHTVISYREAFQKYAGIDVATATDDELLSLLDDNLSLEGHGRDALLNVILGVMVEPHLGQEGLCTVAYYPASQAALAKTRHQDGMNVAERFELYYQGVELSNGYHELTDATEQKRRFEEANRLRVQLGKAALPIDSNFLEALKKGLPDCCGVAVGFDRLMMLRHGVGELRDIMPFSWEDA